jgi:hypothetical protein
MFVICLYVLLAENVNNCHYYFIAYTEYGLDNTFDGLNNPRKTSKMVAITIVVVITFNATWFT